MGKIEIIETFLLERLEIKKKTTTFAPAITGVAQLVEHRSPKPGVGSSSLSSRATLNR